MIAWLMCIGVAMAGPMRVVLSGDTVLSLAGGDAALADDIREQNGLTGEPAVGSLLELPAGAADHANQGAFLIARVGMVTVQAVGEGVAPLRLHVPVGIGSTVCTGARSSATLRLATQCTDDGQAGDDVVLGAETCVQVEHVYADTDERSTVIRVLKGEIAVQDNAAAGSVSVLTDAGLTTGESGGFRVTVEEEASRTEALTASVAVAAEGVALELAAGQGSRTNVGEAPGPAVDLLLPGRPTRPGDGDELVRPTFEWTPVEQALGYRVEFAADPSFTEVLQSQNVGATPWSPVVFTLPWPSSGALFWRVASFDRLGFLGVPSAAFAMNLPKGVGR